MDVTIFRYSANQQEEASDKLEDLKTLKAEDKVWIDIETADAEAFAPIAEQFKLHELAVEDCFTRGHFPKLEEFSGYGYLFIMLRGLKSIQDIEEIRALEDHEEEYNSEKLTRSVAIFLGDNFIITHRLYEVSWLDAAVRQFKNNPDSFQSFNPKEIALRIADVLTHRFQRGMNYFEDQIDAAEDLVIQEPEKFEMLDLLELKRDLNILLSINRDQQGIFTRLSQDEKLIPSRRTRRYFKNVEDRTSTILQSVQRLIDNIASVRDVYVAMSNVRLGDIMRILAIITTIAAPLHLVVGLYGMNFQAIPLLHDKNGFWLIIGTMTILVIAMLTFFKKKNWI